ncbi:putative two-component histidine kinase [Sphingomonas changbaiensis NBRC 104936]|uniref:histidine kinase n=2 Tax=Sphingomonas changbaiensis TaxID=529705 RepID=A0A0E9MN04_9SPHN|nr:putative two-component histidine kinase [Sphingomonas changbaiensis NBRC 104936]
MGANLRRLRWVCTSGCADAIKCKSLMLNFLQPVLETALDAVVAMAPDGTVAAWNAVAEQVFGWTEAEVLGRPLADLIIPQQHREAHRAGLERYNRTGRETILNRRIEITAVDRAGREFPVELSITTAPDRLLFIGFLRDITARREAEARLQRQAREAQLLFEVASLATSTNSFEDALRACLNAICDLTGWPLGHALLLIGTELVSMSVWHDDTKGAADALREATEQIRFTSGVGLPGMVLAAGEPIWIADAAEASQFPRKGLGLGAAFGFPLKSEGRIIAVLEFFTYDRVRPDPELMLVVRTLGEQVGRVLERKRTEDHQELLLHELNHRVKNMLSIVQSVAMQTFKGAAPREAIRTFETRLGALAAAHDLLIAENWEAASLQEIVSKAGLGCGADRDRIRTEGPELRLHARAAVSLSLALHELCTNAVKYGALSTEGGRIHIAWHIVHDGTRLCLVWQEQGGPAVQPPQARGFGSRMIERALAAELGGKVELHFLPEGLRCVIEAPLPAEDR